MARIPLAEVNLIAEEAPDAVALDPDRPFRILLVGDFSGRSWRESPPAPLVPRVLDRDNFDDVMASLHVSLDVHGMPLVFRELEDFHPDRIFQAAPVFRDLDRLAAAATPLPAAAPPASGGSLLDQMMAGEEEPSRPVRAEDANDLAGFIRRATAGHLVPRETPAQQQREARRNGLANELMRGILHHPRLQALEAAWRGADRLVRGLDTDSELKVYLLDLTLPELVSEMDAVRTELKRKGPWGLIAGNYAFGQSELDAQVLARIAAMAKALGGPFVAEARIPESGPDPAWNELRRSAAARWLGLVLPRFLLRLPYGKDTSAIESFAFEEMPRSEHSDYLWGSPAFFCAQLIGQSFLAHGWDFARRLSRRIDNLPLHTYRDDDGETVAKPCAEILMSERDAEQLLESGLMPLASIKHEAAALIVRFQSVAEPPAGLAGLGGPA